MLLEAVGLQVGCLFQISYCELAHEWMCVIAPLMFNMQGGPAGMALELNRGVVCMEPDEFQRVKGGKN